MVHIIEEYLDLIETVNKDCEDYKEFATSISSNIIMAFKESIRKGFYLCKYFNDEFEKKKIFYRILEINKMKNEEIRKKTGTWLQKICSYKMLFEKEFIYQNTEIDLEVALTELKLKKLFEVKIPL